jgi:hypothetical protein
MVESGHSRGTRATSTTTSPSKGHRAFRGARDGDLVVVLAHHFDHAVTDPLLHVRIQDRGFDDSALSKGEGAASDRREKPELHVSP